MIIFLAIVLIIVVSILIVRAQDKKEEAKSKAEAEKIAAAAEAKAKAETEAKAKAEQEAKVRAELRAKTIAEQEERDSIINTRNSFKTWWFESRFNSFTVLEKRTPMHFNGKRYMAVRHVITNKCYNLEVDVTTYFNHDVGAELRVTDIKYDYITEEAFAEFTTETGVSGVSLESLRSVWTLEEDISEILQNIRSRSRPKPSHGFVEEFSPTRSFNKFSF